MYREHDIIVRGINACTKVRLTFYSKDDGYRVSRVCAPMDFGPSRRAKNPGKRYHFWDYEGGHQLSILPDQIRQVEALAESFDPAEFVTWRPAWFLKRNWGRFS